MCLRGKQPGLPACKMLSPQRDNHYLNNPQVGSTFRVLKRLTLRVSPCDNQSCDNQSALPPHRLPFLPIHQFSEQTFPGCLFGSSGRIQRCDEPVAVGPQLPCCRQAQVPRDSHPVSQVPGCQLHCAGVECRLVCWTAAAHPQCLVAGLLGIDAQHQRVRDMP